MSPYKACRRGEGSISSQRQLGGAAKCTMTQGAGGTSKVAGLAKHQLGAGDALSRRGAKVFSCKVSGVP